MASFRNRPPKVSRPCFAKQTQLQRQNSHNPARLSRSHLVGGLAGGDSSQRLAHCFLRVSRLGIGAFDLLSRYEVSLWRQAAQLLFMLQSAARSFGDSRTQALFLDEFVRDFQGIARPAKRRL